MLIFAVDPNAHAGQRGSQHETIELVVGVTVNTSVVVLRIVVIWPLHWPSSNRIQRSTTFCNIKAQGPRRRIIFSLNHL